MIKKHLSPIFLMTRIIPFLLIPFLIIIAGAPAWPQEKASPPENPQPQGSTPPAEPAQPPTTTTPEGTPAQSPAQPAAPAQAPGTAPSEGTPEAKPQENVQKALQATEEEKEKTVTKQVEQSVVGTAIRGRLELEFNENYAHLSSNQLFIEGFGILPILIVGQTSVERVRRDVFITTFVARYKVSEDLQAELRVPYSITYIRVSEATGIIGKSVVTPEAEQTSSGRGLGDVSGSLSYHLANETLVRPSMYVALGLKGRTGRDVFETTDPIKDPPTGSGFNSVSLTVNAIKTSDPAVIYGQLSYSYAMSRQNVVLNRPNGQPPILVNFYPGDNIGYGFGIAYALNYKITISIGYQQSINLPSRITNLGLPHNELPNSVTDAATLRFGMVWRVNDKTSVDLSVSPGLTLDAPDLQVALRIPYRF